MHNNRPWYPGLLSPQWDGGRAPGQLFASTGSSFDYPYARGSPTSVAVTQDLRGLLGGSPGLGAIDPLLLHPSSFTGHSHVGTQAYYPTTSPIPQYPYRQATTGPYCSQYTQSPPYHQQEPYGPGHPAVSTYPQQPSDIPYYPSSSQLLMASGYYINHPRAPLLPEYIDQSTSFLWQGPATNWSTPTHHLGYNGWGGAGRGPGFMQSTGTLPRPNDLSVGHQTLQHTVGHAQHPLPAPNIFRHFQPQIVIPPSSQLQTPNDNPRKPRPSRKLRGPYQKQESTRYSGNANPGRLLPPPPPPMVPRRHLRTQWQPELSTSSHSQPSMEAPPSPTMATYRVPRIRPRRSQAQAATPIHEQPSAHVCQGFGPTQEVQIRVDESSGVRSVKRMGNPEMIPGKEGLFFRCRWDGCRQMVPATEKAGKKHLYQFHGCRKTGREHIACQWKPALLVEFPGREDQVFVSSHRDGYTCNFTVLPGSMFKHTCVHLRHEEQPNPDVDMCQCGRPKIGRGTHKCQNTKPNEGKIGGKAA